MDIGLQDARYVRGMLMKKLYAFVYVVIITVLLANRAVAEPIKVGRVSSNSSIATPSFQIILPLFNDVENNPVDGWNQYSDKSRPNELILVTGASHDMHFRKYSTYAISTKEHQIKNDIQTMEQALTFSKQTYKWKTIPIAQKNQYQAICISENNHEYSSDEAFIYNYQSVCFNFLKHIATEFSVSIVKLDRTGTVVGTYPDDQTATVPISPAFIQFTQDLLSSYQPL